MKVIWHAIAISKNGKLRILGTYDKKSGAIAHCNYHTADENEDAVVVSQSTDWYVKNKGKL